MTRPLELEHGDEPTITVDRRLYRCLEWIVSATCALTYTASTSTADRVTVERAEWDELAAALDTYYPTLRAVREQRFSRQIAMELTP